jgi:hypothetical protein
MNWIGFLMSNYIQRPLKAIRKKCLDCADGQVKEIRYCTVINCAIYPYRFGRRPDRATIDTINEYYGEKT